MKTKRRFPKKQHILNEVPQNTKILTNQLTEPKPSAIKPKGKNRFGCVLQSTETRFFLFFSLYPFTNPTSLSAFLHQYHFWYGTLVSLFFYITIHVTAGVTQPVSVVVPQKSAYLKGLSESAWELRQEQGLSVLLWIRHFRYPTCIVLEK